MAELISGDRSFQKTFADPFSKEMQTLTLRNKPQVQGHNVVSFKEKS